MRRITRPPCPNPEALENENYKHVDNKTALREASEGKCMYCESRICATYPGDVEHIRPKGKPEYSHLEFEWSNLGFVCWRCNNNKSSTFDEAYPFIDPYSEDPKLHFWPCGDVIIANAGNERAHGTVDVIKLNRKELRSARSEAIYHIQNAAESAMAAISDEVRKSRLETLKAMCDANSEFSFVCEPVVEKFLDDLG